ncbi:MAG: hypothetical protein IKQ46_02260 [Bacteroidales bacterium]|nr:hypothetical protein [Bacteroidales bacterium]
MKKIFLFIPMLIAVLIFQSCKGDMGPMGPMGPAGEDGVVLIHRFDLEINSNDWEKVDNQYFRYRFELPELTETMCIDGVVSAYITWEDNGVQYQSQLPQTRYYSEEKNNDDGTSETIFYSTTIDYEYAPGELTVFYTNSDFFVNERPQSLKLRVIVHY